MKTQDKRAIRAGLCVLAVASGVWITDPNKVRGGERRDVLYEQYREDAAVRMYGAAQQTSKHARGDSRQSR